MLLELVLLSALITFTLYIHFLTDRLSFKGIAFYGIYSQAANTIVAYITVGLLIDAFVRIVKCARGELAISKFQIFWQISCLFIYAMALTVLLAIFAHKESTGLTGKHSVTMETSEEFYLIISIVLAELPLIHILNSLVT